MSEKRSSYRWKHLLMALKMGKKDVFHVVVVLAFVNVEEKRKREVAVLCIREFVRMDIFSSQANASAE